MKRSRFGSFLCRHQTIIWMAAAIIVLGGSFALEGLQKEPKWREHMAAVATAATAMFTLALVWVTAVLAKETTSLRRQSADAAKQAIRPQLIMYTELDEHSDHARIILENATDNPAFDVRLRFVVDPIIAGLKNELVDPDQPISSLFMPHIDVLPPRQKVSRTFAVFGKDKFPVFEAKIEMTYKDLAGDEVVTPMRVNTDPTHKRWRTDKRHPSHRNEAIQNVGASIAKALKSVEAALGAMPKVAAPPKRRSSKTAANKSAKPIFETS